MKCNIIFSNHFSSLIRSSYSKHLNQINKDLYVNAINQKSYTFSNKSPYKSASKKYRIRIEIREQIVKKFAIFKGYKLKYSALQVF